MVIGNLVNITKKRFEMMLLVGALVGATAFAVTIFTQKNYRSTIDILVVQNQEGFSDYYALSKSADYLSRVLSESVYSEKFIDEATATGKLAGFNLVGDKVNRLKQWKKIVTVNRKADTGILQVVVRGDNAQQLGDGSDAVIDVLTNKQFLFLGRGQNVEVRVLSGPLVEKNLTLAKMLLVILGGAVFGFFLCFIIFFFNDSQSDGNDQADGNNGQSNGTDEWPMVQNQTNETPQLQSLLSEDAGTFRWQ